MCYYHHCGRVCINVRFPKNVFVPFAMFPDRNRHIELSFVCPLGGPYIRPCYIIKHYTYQLDNRWGSYP